MTLSKLLERFVPGAARHPDHNLALLEHRLTQGYSPVWATTIPAESSPFPGPAVLLRVEREGESESIPVCLGPAALALLRSRFPDLPVRDGAEGADTPPVSALARKLAELFARSESLPPEERARILAGWILEQTEGSRCALIPVSGGTFGPPLAFTRGRTGRDVDPSQVPRGIIEEVRIRRELVVRHDTAAPEISATPSASTLRQQVGSFLAAPVLFRGELLAVAYVDRFRQKGEFSRAAQAAFHAIAYELARPLVELSDEQRRREYQELRDALLRRGPRALPLVSSPALDRVLEQARCLARLSDENLIILGETGAGKEVLARYIHEASGLSGRFVAINLAAIPDNLFESELMGSVRGAFTGAEDRPGRVLEAEGGTLFLDEIGDLAAHNQVKLLRFLEDKRVIPIGGRAGRAVELRVIAATNRPIEQMAERGDFRADLFHRFAPALRVPPLRERREEILPLARTWLATKARKRGAPSPELTTDAIELLRSHAWPGNVRQLEVVLSHALALERSGKIDAALLGSLLAPIAPAPAAAAEPKGWTDWCAEGDARERAWLEASLTAEGGNVSAAARRVACPPTTFRRLLLKHGLLARA